jgi:hypothetical protein
MEGIEFSFHPASGPRSADKFFTQMRTAWNAVAPQEDSKERAIIPPLMKKFKQKLDLKCQYHRHLRDVLERGLQPQSFKEFELALTSAINLQSEYYLNGLLIGMDKHIPRAQTTKTTEYPSKSSKSAGGAQKRTRTDGHSGDARATSSVTCWCCGRDGHRTHHCRLAGHPDCNKEKCPWSESDKGKEWRKRNPPRSVLPSDITLSGEKWPAPSGGAEKYSGDRMKPGELSAAIQTDVSSHTDSLSGVLLYPQGGGKAVNVLPDTGAPEHSYISRLVYSDYLNGADCKCSDGTSYNTFNQKTSTEFFRVCSAMSGSDACVEAQQSNPITLRLLSSSGSVDIAFRPLIIDT